MNIDFLEIGTSNFDTLLEDVNDNIVGISVEPIKHYLDALPNRKNVIKVNTAITANRTTDSIDVYYIPEKVINELNIGSWMKGCNRINEYHPLHIKGNFQKYVKIEKVPLINIDEFLIKYNIRTIKYLKIDTEGHDVIILKGLFNYLKTKSIEYFPQKILFESNSNINIEDVDNIIKLAVSMGYTLLSRGEDTLMILNDNNLQVLDDAIKEMNIATFEKKQHSLTIFLFNKYKMLAFNNENKTYYNTMCHLVNISAYYTRDIKIGYECCKYLIINNIEIDINNVYYNMIFYINELDNDTNKGEVIQLLNSLLSYKNRIYNINPKLSEQIQNYCIKYKIIDNSIMLKKVKKAKESKKILIYTGYAFNKWNYSYCINNAASGSEKAPAFLANEFSKNYKIYISGDVIEEKIDNVEYVHMNNLNKLLETTEFHTIIISRYVSFFELYKNFNCYKLILVLHDAAVMNNSPYSNTPAKQILFDNLPIIDNIVTLTNWHKNNTLWLYNFINPDTVKVINNGILTNNYNPYLEFCSYKIKNSFIYLSSYERGLERLLELWPEILNKLPNATLNICSYNSFPNSIIEKINNFKLSINLYGKLNQNELNELSKRTEYWLYPLNGHETSCISGLEMLLNEVICVYYPKTGLKDTLEDNGVKVQHGNEIENILELSKKDKTDIRLKGKLFALKCSWKEKAKEWSELMQLE